MAGIATAALFTGVIADAPPRGAGVQQSAAPAGGWSWFSGPRALYYGGVTYWAYVEGSDGDAVVAARDGDGDITTFALAAALQADDHADPALMVRNGYLWAFYAKHNDTVLRWRRTTNPLPDISSWTAEATCYSGSDVTYALPWTDGDDIRVLTRDISGGSTLFRMVTSSDGGANWSAAATVYDDGARRSYLIGWQDGDRMHFAVSDGHPELQATMKVLHFYVEGGTAYGTGGGALSYPVSNATATLVYDGGAARPWVMDIATDESGSPVIAFTHYVSTSDHRYHYATWDGEAWSNAEFAAGGGAISASDDPYYSGGIALDRDDPREVYASIGVGSGVWEMRRYVKRASWTSRTLTTTGKHIRPAAVKDPGPLRALWMAGTYTEFTDYSVGTWGATR